VTSRSSAIETLRRGCVDLIEEADLARPTTEAAAGSVIVSAPALPAASPSGKSIPRRMIPIPIGRSSAADVESG
jgi:hypothetical protein